MYDVDARRCRLDSSGPLVIDRKTNSLHMGYRGSSAISSYHCWTTIWVRAVPSRSQDPLVLNSGNVKLRSSASIKQRAASGL